MGLCYREITNMYRHVKKEPQDLLCFTGSLCYSEVEVRYIKVSLYLIECTSRNVLGNRGDECRLSVSYAVLAIYMQGQI